MKKKSVNVAKVKDTGKETLEMLEKVDNYSKQAFNIMSKHFGKTILEIGSGIGTNVPYFKGKKIVLTDISKEYVQILKKKYPKASSYVYDCSKSNIGFLKKHKIDTILCCNVLEHIKDDKKTIQNFAKILPKGGKLILWVPAHKHLYSDIDKNLLHYRRYSKKELKEKLSEYFDIELKRFNTMGYPGWLLYGPILKKQILPKKQLKLYNQLSKMNVWLDKVSPFFLSYIVICERK